MLLTFLNTYYKKIIIKIHNCIKPCVFIRLFNYLGDI